MSSAFLDSVMQFAISVTQAERSLAVDTGLNIRGMVNLDEATVKSEAFIDLASQTVSQALEQNEAIITNNVITDPSQAPTTNTNFADLRVIVAIPVKDIGAVYVDQHIRNGVISRDIIDKVHQVVEKALEEGNLEITGEELTALYKQM